MGGITHAFVSSKGDPADSGVVGQTKWNADHVVKAFALDGGVVSPSQLTSNQNDYNPTNLADASQLRLDLSAARTITGLQGGSTGRLILLTNISSYPLTVADESSSSTAANRFSLSAQNDIYLLPEETLGLIYDATSSRWRELFVPRPGEIVRQLASDSTNSSSSTISDVSGLSFTAAAGATYEVDVIGAMQSAATTTGMWLGLNTPASPTLVVGEGFNPAASTQTVTLFTQTSDDTVLVASSGVPATSTNYPVVARFLLVNGSNAGTVQLRMRSEVNSSQVTLKAGTIMRARRII